MSKIIITINGKEVHCSKDEYIIDVAKEKGIDISKNVPKNIDEFLDREFDYVITVCDNAKESCPVFTGKVKNRLHIGFEDPALAVGTKEEVMNVYRKTRDKIRKKFFEFLSDVYKC